MKSFIIGIGALLEIIAFIALPFIAVAALPTLEATKTQPKPWEINRPKPPCPFPEGNKHWGTAEEWHTWCTISAYIKEMNPKLSEGERHSMADAIMEWSGNYSLPVGLIVAVCHTESNFNARALGPRTRYGRAHGAMQVMWPVHKALAESCSVSQEDLLSASGGVQIGTLLLRRYIQDEGSIAGGLSRYYSKPSSRYVVEKIMSSYLTFEQLHNRFISVTEVSKAYQSEAEKLRKIVRGR